MSDLARATARKAAQAAGRQQVSVIPALVKTAAWVNGAPETVVTVGGVDFTNLPVAGSFALLPGQTVNVLRMRSQLVILGPVSTDAHPPQGTVSATGSSTCEVLIAYSQGERTIACPWVAPYSPAIGDVVLLQWFAGNAVVFGRLSQSLPTALTPPYIPVAPPPLPRAGESLFTASDSGTLSESGEWGPGTQLVASVETESIGFWFYGTKIRDTLVTKMASEIQPMQIFVEDSVASSGFQMFLHTAASRAQAVYDSSTTPAVDVPAVDGPHWVDLPVEWAAALMKDGGGIGIQPSEEPATLLGIGENTQSGTLRLVWLEDHPRSNEP